MQRQFREAPSFCSQDSSRTREEHLETASEHQFYAEFPNISVQEPPTLKDLRFLLGSIFFCLGSANKLLEAYGGRLVQAPIFITAWSWGLLEFGI